MQLDEVLRLSACAIEAVVEPLRRAIRKIGDDEANVEPQPRRLDAGDRAALPAPGPSPVARLGVGAHDVSVFEGALDTDSLGRLIDFHGQRPVSGKAEDIIEAMIFMPGHRLGPRIMSVAAKQDALIRPAVVEMAQEPAQMSADLDAGRRLA